MKKLLTITLTAALAVSAFAQGKVSMNNLSSTLISTNAVGAGGTAGATGTAAQGFYYGLLAAASTVTTVDANAQNLLTPTWTFTGAYATNIAAGGRETSGTQTTTAGWPLGVTNSYVIVGWSSNLGHDWSVIAGKLAGANLTGGVWSGANWGAIVGNAFIGVSPVAYGSVDSGGVTTYSLFGTTATAQGLPLTSGFSLNVIAVPEPTSIALAGLGTAALLIFRRRK